MRDRYGREVLLHWGPVARAASTCFTVLFIGGWLYPAAQKLSPPAGICFAVVIAVIGFGAAGARCREVEFAALHGVLGAILGYALMVPVVWIAHRELFFAQLGWAILGAVLVGGATAHLAARRSSRPEEPKRGGKTAGGRPARNRAPAKRGPRG